jgi:hypothetical protein
MSKDYKCPACQNAVERGATICSNSVCRAALAFCSHCRDVTTYTLVEKGEGRFKRDKYKCTRCEGIGVKCLTWLTGGDEYCNGLARAGTRVDNALCAACKARGGEIARTVLSWSMIGAVGGWLKPRR